MEEVNKPTKQLGEVFEKTSFRNEVSQEVVPIEIESDKSGDDIESNIRATPNNSKFSNSMRETFGSLMHSCNSLKITQNELCRANNLGVLFQILGADRIQINDKSYDLTTEIYKTLSSHQHHTLVTIRRMKMIF